RQGGSRPDGDAPGPGDGADRLGEGRRKGQPTVRGDRDRGRVLDLIAALNEDDRASRRARAVADVEIGWDRVGEVVVQVQLSVLHDGLPHVDVAAEEGERSGA